MCGYESECVYAFECVRVCVCVCVCVCMYTVAQSQIYLQI